MNIREATKDDIDAILGLIKELAIYEKLEDKITFTKDLYQKALFEEKIAHALVCENGDKIIGYAIYFYSFSTFLGRGGIYLEDLYVKNEFRNQGIGKKFFQILAKICVEKNFGRIEWSCLKWNEPSLKFYEKIGANRQNEWEMLRLDGEALKNLAKIL